VHSKFVFQINSNSSYTCFSVVAHLTTPHRNYSATCCCGQSQHFKNLHSKLVFQITCISSYTCFSVVAHLTTPHRNYSATRCCGQSQYFTTQQIGVPNYSHFPIYTCFSVVAHLTTPHHPTTATILLPVDVARVNILKYYTANWCSKLLAFLHIPVSVLSLTLPPHNRNYSATCCCGQSQYFTKQQICVPNYSHFPIYTCLK
jgi:hypothetical protein